MSRSTLIAPLSLLLLASCASTHPIEPSLAPASVAFSSAQRIEVTLANFEFRPQQIALVAGQPIVLVLSNTTDGGHNFAAADFFAAAQVRAEDAATIASGAVEVPAHDSIAIGLVPTAGAYRLACTHFGHSALGMTGSISVE